jgi:N-acetyl-alpha-D-muramate 1-phosphate uridylyltransferase
MRAMILAAGRGERMGDLTKEVPKPLLKVKGQYLIEYALQTLIKAGIQDVVINICYRGEQIKQALGNGARYGINIIYSEEQQALETGGGIFQALPLLGPKPFLVLSSDIISDYPISQLPNQPTGLAHLVLIDNPSFHPIGDFSLNGDKVSLGQSATYTFANIGIYKPELFKDCQPGRFRLGDLLKKEIQNQQITGEYYQGLWHNIGTLTELNKVVSV